MNKTKKNKRIEIRLSEEDYNIIKKKAESYPSMSAFILDAIKLFNSDYGRAKIDRLRKFSDDYRKFDYELNRVGNNINQMAHYINTLKLMNVVNHQILEEHNKLMKSLTLLLKKINQSNMIIIQEAKDIL